MIIISHAEVSGMRVFFKLLHEKFVMTAAFRYDRSLIKFRISHERDEDARVNKKKKFIRFRANDQNSMKGAFGECTFELLHGVFS